MTQSTTASSTQSCLFSPVASFFLNIRTASTAGLAATALLAAAIGAHAQAAAPDAAQTPSAAAQTAAPAPKPDIALTNQKAAKKRKQQKEEKVVESKDTKKEDKKTQKTTSLEGEEAKLPDKELYDKAEDAVKHGHYDVARLDLQTLLNTYPESQFMMRAKLAIADSWYKEGGTAALTQAEQEYKDFITFFPNAPEAAEAQMRVGDIYFRQMDKPDRDDTNTVQAEQEYRLMLQQFPDSPLVPQARQRLREVQETLAAREATIGEFYAERQPPDLVGAIARFETVVDTYPLYSHMDDVLIGLGDAYEGEARLTRASRLPPGWTPAEKEVAEANKARLEKIYDDEAAAAYRKVVLEHSASPHVEDAKDRLVGMGLPIPTPTPEQVAASEALENSRGQYTLSKRATLMFLHQADTVQAATVGDPPLEDPKPVSAAAVIKQANLAYATSMTPATNKPPQVAAAATPASSTDAAAAESSAAAPARLQDVPTDTTGGNTAPVDTNVQVAPAATSSGTGMGIEIVHSDSTTPSTAPATPPAFPGTDAPATTPAAAPAAGDQAKPAADNGGIGPVGPPNATPLPPVQAPAKAPEAINEAAQSPQPPAQVAPADGRKPKVECDTSDESCSRHKKKKGLAKLNPF